MTLRHRLVLTIGDVPTAGAKSRVSRISEILSEACRAQQAAGITGVLAIHDGLVIQIVEGSAEATEAVLDQARRQLRHDEVRVVASGPIDPPGCRSLATTVVTWPLGDRVTLDALPGGSLRALPAEAVDRIVQRMLELADVQRVAGSPLPGAEEPKEDVGLPSAAEVRVLLASSATAVFSSDGRLTRASPLYCALFGRDAEALLGCGHEDLAVGAGGPGIPDHQSLWASLRRGRVSHTEYRAGRPDDREVWVRSTLTPAMSAEGVLLDVVEVAEDVSEQVRRNLNDRGQIAAIDRSQLVTHFAVDGTILAANSLFLAAMGYDLDEVVGQRHRMFVDPVVADSEDYAAFWKRLAAGGHCSGEVRRRDKHGRDVWLQATYSPIFDLDGRVLKIIKYATDVTSEKLRQADFQQQVTAIHTSHAVVTFTMDGLIIDANQSFLDAFGYQAGEVVGRHHRMFVDPSYSHGSDYAAFWRELGRGNYQEGIYRRFDRNGREVWLQATYNPIRDLGGKLLKVVKYATVVTEERLRQAEHQGQIAAIHKALCVVAFDLAGTILDANDNFLAAVGYSLLEVRGRKHAMFVEPAFADSDEYKSFWTALAAGRHQIAEFKRFGKDGREVWFQATYNPIFDGSGRPFRIMKYATDVTNERMLQADLHGQIAAIRKSQGVISFGMDGLILDANQRFLETVGYSLDEIVGQHHRILVDPVHAASSEYMEFWRTLQSGEFLSGMFKRLGKSGREVWIQASYNPILDPNGKPFKVVKFASDVTANVAMSEAFEDAKRQAQHDRATSLPNRRRLASFMADVLAQPTSRLAALYIDVDHFRAINETHGQDVGDRLLGEVADRLRRCLSFDQLAARVGGSEFVVVAPDLDNEQVEVLAQRLTDAVALPVSCEDGEFQVSASIGVAVAPSDATTPDELLRCADAALSRSKAAGGANFCFFSATLNDRIQNYRSLVKEMQHGLVNNEFFVEYQPRFGTADRRVRSVEALVRWNHPERGRVSPGEFIPAAERSGIIVELGEWVLRAACLAAAAWPSIGVSVNVSPLQFTASNLVQVVDNVLADTGLAPHRLELEITEGMLLKDGQRARSILESLKRRGVKLAIDDFGTGYSSLSSLRTFPFDVIKIDRQFIIDMEADEGGREVVQAILSLGRALGLSVTAEGVETDVQLRMLADDRCHEIQGFLLGRPMPCGKIDELLAPQAAAEAEAAMGQTAAAPSEVSDLAA